jgi:hypothetical protein
VRSGQDGIIVPSATRPVFWEEDGIVKTLGILDANVIGRYIKLHADIVVDVGAGLIDLILPNSWDGEIVDRMMVLANADATKNVQN